MRWEESGDVEGDLDSWTDDKETVELPLTDTVLSAEIKEDKEEDTEDVCWAGGSWEVEEVCEEE